MKNIFFFAAILISFTASAQKISNKLNFQKGQKLEVTSQISIAPEGGMGMALDGIITRLFDIEDVKANAATIEHKVKLVQFNIDLMGEVQSFNSDKEEDMKGPLGKSFEKGIKNKYSMTLDATGKITNVKLDDNNPNTSVSNNPEGDMFANVLNQVMNGLEVPAVGDKTIFSVIPADNISKGFNWTDTTNQAVSGKRTYTIEDISDTEIFINLTGENAVERTEESMGMQATISTKENATGKIILDRKSGLIKSEEITIISKGSISAGGQAFPLNNTIKRKLSVKNI